VKQLFALVAAAIVASACGQGGPAAPTAVPSSGAGAFTVSGTIADENGGRPIPDASIDIASGIESRSGLSDAGGFYAVQRLPPGRWNVTVSKPGYETEYGSVDVSKDTTLSFELTRIRPERPGTSF